MGQPVLLKSAAVIADPTSKQVEELDDMVETMEDAVGVGLLRRKFTKVNAPLFLSHRVNGAERTARIPILLR